MITKTFEAMDKFSQLNPPSLFLKASGGGEPDALQVQLRMQVNRNLKLVKGNQTCFGGPPKLVLCFFLFLSCVALPGQGIPEPSLVFYGTIRNAAQNNLRVTSGSLDWQIRKISTGRTIGLSTSVSNYSGFSYLLEVPAETIVTGTVSTNALDLSASSFLFSHLQVSYGGTPLSFMVSTQSTFTASSRQRGRMERVDLTISLPCGDADGNGLCDDWELRYFGFIGVDLDADDDGDGMKNWAEYRAGTHPLDASSVFQFINYELLPGGAMRVEWESADGRSYRLWRGTNVFHVISTNLPQVAGLTLVRSNLVATPPLNSFTDSDSVPPGPYFYRLELEQ